jgi:hypothetical protein
MKKALIKTASKLTGDTKNLRGYVSPYLSGYVSPYLSGDVSGLRGNVSGLSGYVSPYLSGDVSGLSGDVTGLRGNVDECDLTPEEREQGVAITDLIRETPDK